MSCNILHRYLFSKRFRYIKCDETNQSLDCNRPIRKQKMDFAFKEKLKNAQRSKGEMEF